MCKQVIIFATIGHTAAGKTTLSKKVCSEFCIEHIAEGQIKRDIIGNYSTKDSLNEDLRDIAYVKAVEKAKIFIDEEKSVLLDASFHKKKRRELVYRLLENKNNVFLVWLYCYCPNIEKIKNRIFERKKAQKSAETQADSMAIYNHIISTFDLPSLDEIPKSICAAIIYYNTDINRIDNIEFNTGSELLTQTCERVRRLIIKENKE